MLSVGLVPWETDSRLNSPIGRFSHSSPSHPRCYLLNFGTLPFRSCCPERLRSMTHVALSYTTLHDSPAHALYHFLSLILFAISPLRRAYLDFLLSVCIYNCPPFGPLPYTSYWDATDLTPHPLYSATAPSFIWIVSPLHSSPRPGTHPPPTPPAHPDRFSPRGSQSLSLGLPIPTFSLFLHDVRAFLPFSPHRTKSTRIIDPTALPSSNDIPLFQRITSPFESHLPGEFAPLSHPPHNHFVPFCP